jgi:dUTP pyrophosphatase
MFKKRPKNDFVKIKLICDFPEVTPTRQTKGSAGYDVRARIEGGSFPLLPYMPTIISCGFKMELPEGYHAKICQRSSMGKNGIIIPNSPGIIDSDYRGYVSVLLLNLNNEIMDIKNGQRIAQMLIEKNINAKWVEVDSLKQTKRGAGGFGSTKEI